MSAKPSTLLFSHSTPGLARRPLRGFLKSLQTEVAAGRTFDVLVTDDAQLRELNEQFLGKKYATDVLSFPAPPPTEELLGEIAISLQRAQAQAAEHGHTVDEEIRILMLHGVLHLLGMDHEQDSGEMARAERKWRRQLGLPAGLIERVRA